MTTQGGPAAVQEPPHHQLHFRAMPCYVATRASPILAGQRSLSRDVFSKGFHARCCQVSSRYTLQSNRKSDCCFLGSRTRPRLAHTLLIISSLARAASACRLQSGTRRAAKHADKGQTCETHLGRPGLLQTWGAKAGLRPAAIATCGGYVCLPAQAACPWPRLLTARWSHLRQTWH